MNFEETEEQSMIREMVRDFAEEVLLPTVNSRDSAQSPPREEWKAFIDSGLHSITIPEEFGGNPVDHISEAIIIDSIISKTCKAISPLHRCLRLFSIE